MENFLTLALVDAPRCRRRHVDVLVPVAGVFIISTQGFVEPAIDSVGNVRKAKPQLLVRIYLVVDALPGCPAERTVDIIPSRGTLFVRQTQPFAVDIMSKALEILLTELNFIYTHLLCFVQI